METKAEESFYDVKILYEEIKRLETQQNRIILEMDELSGDVKRMNEMKNIMDEMEKEMKLKDEGYRYLKVCITILSSISSILNINSLIGLCYQFAGQLTEP